MFLFNVGTAGKRRYFKCYSLSIEGIYCKRETMVATKYIYTFFHELHPPIVVKLRLQTEWREKRCFIRAAT